jgi:hypothetical protein
MEQTIEQPANIDGTTYDNFKGMLSSTDRENAHVALTILEQADYKKCFPYILMLLKDQISIQEVEWTNAAPKLHNKLKELNVSLGFGGGEQLTFKRMFDIVKDDCDKTAVQFIINKFAKTLEGLLAEWGIDLIKELDLKLDLKEV